MNDAELAEGSGRGTARGVWTLRTAVWALGSWVALTSVSPGRAPAADPAPPRPELAAEAARILSQAIRIRSTNPPGDEAQLAQYLVDELRDASVEAQLVDTPSLPGAGRRAAAWGRVKGRGVARPVILLSHLDVVPANPSDWSRDPFAGVVEDGFVFGRGALDAKGVAVIHLLTLVELARREEPLARDVIFLATPDEESGGASGAGYLARDRPDLLDNAEYLLTEGGGILVGSSPELQVWGIGVTEKSPCWLGLRAHGTPGHSSAPDPDAAVPKLVAALDRIRRIETKIRVVPEVERMFRELAPRAAPEDRAGYLDLAAQLESDANFRERFLASRARSALVRNTVSITVLEGAPRINMAPGEAHAKLDARLLPGEDCEAFRADVAAVISDPSVEVKVEMSFSSSSSPIDTDLYRSITRVAGRGNLHALVVPRMIGGFTDAHWFRAQGIVAYGFVPRWLSPEEARGVHGPDERVSIENLERGVRTLIDILEALSSLSPDA